MNRTAWLGLALLLGSGLGCHSSAQPASSPATSGANATSSPSVVELRHIVGSEPAAPSAKAGPQVAKVGAVAPDFELPAYHQGKFTERDPAPEEDKYPAPGDDRTVRNKEN